MQVSSYRCTGDLSGGASSENEKYLSSKTANRQRGVRTMTYSK